ncbi:homogentisate 1,2-dioxygenase [Myxococcota bacterium]|nr:homogentisate 1,2-dioxygenase [Myxococcota bacterium]
MPHYHRLGEIPPKRHIQFRRPDGKLYAEELVSTEGFSNLYSLVYHIHPPTAIQEAGTPYSVAPKVALDKNILPRSFLGFRLPNEGDFLQSRKIVFTNNDLHVALASPRHGTTDFYKNAQSDEVIFVHEGQGTLRTMLGDLAFQGGDYLVIPRGVIYQIDFVNEHNRLFIVESHSPITFPKRYLNDAGQLLEHAPFCERDIRKPTTLHTHDAQGDFKILIKRQDQIYPLSYAYHPFDVIGWDGYFFPYAFSIHDFEPITGRVHQPPPVHQTFAARGFVICSFVPRLYDYHPLAIPAPYHHSNIDSDEVLYYVDGEFMSRKHVERGMISLHPMGIPHGPHPGAIERSIGKKETRELAVMVDTFAPLKITEDALKLEDPLYHKSWLEE